LSFLPAHLNLSRSRSYCGLGNFLKMDAPSGGSPPSCTYRQRRKGEKHTLTVNEVLKKNEDERKKPKVTHKRVRLEGFTIVESGTLTWRGSGGLGEMTIEKRKPSKADIFMALCPTSALEAIVRTYNMTVMKGEHDITVQEL
jgi:hypothetical protein